LQIVFSFYLVAFEGFSAPTQMTPARDRVIGILLALVVMWMIFHQLRPERTVDKMRHGLAQLLAIEAETLSLHNEKSDRVFKLREQADEIVGNVRALAEAIPYELDQHVERDLEISERIQDALVSAGSLFLFIVTAWPQESGSLSQPTLSKTVHAQLEQGLRNLSGVLEGKTGDSESREIPALLSPIESLQSYPEFIRNGLAYYADLQNQCQKIQAEA
jgi:multidrug resistance protein MdtO